MDAEVIKAIPEDDTITREDPRRFTTSNGIIFKLKPVPPLLIIDAQRRFREPEPPKIRNLDKGEGDEAPLEENPNDPSYLRAMEEYRHTIGEVANAIFLTRGIEIISIPDGIDKPEDSDWAEEVHEFAGLDVPAVGRRRLYAWLKYVALTSMDDFQGLINKVAGLGGVTLERDVQDAEVAFRPEPNGSAVAGVSASEEV